MRMCHFWAENGPFAQMRILSENHLISLVLLICAYLHAKNQSQILIKEIQWILSISTTLCLEYTSNKMFGPLKFPPRTLHSLSLFQTSLSQTFHYIEQMFRSLEPFSISILNIYIFEFQNKFESESKQKF